MKVFLFDELGELIKHFPNQEDAAAAIGVGVFAVRAAIERCAVVSGRYYFATTSKLPAMPRKGIVRNLVAAGQSTKGMYNHADAGRHITAEESRGLSMLGSNDGAFDSYLFGSLGPYVERAESIPAWKSKFWKEGDSNFNY